MLDVNFFLVNKEFKIGTNTYFDASLVLIVLDDNCLQLVQPLENHTSCDFILSGHLKSSLWFFGFKYQLLSIFSPLIGLTCFITTIISLSKRKHVLSNLKLFIKVKQCFKLCCHFWKPILLQISIELPQNYLKVILKKSWSLNSNQTRKSKNLLRVQNVMQFLTQRWLEKSIFLVLTFVLKRQNS